MWYKFNILARENGAVGCRYNYDVTIDGETEEEAILNLYIRANRFEHISVIDFHPCTPEEIEEYFKD